jgi:hypothetical protein
VQDLFVLNFKRTEIVRFLNEVLTLESFFKLSRSRQTATFSKISCERHSKMPKGPSDIQRLTATGKCFLCIGGRSVFFPTNSLSRCEFWPRVGEVQFFVDRAISHRQTEQRQNGPIRGLAQSGSFNFL